MSFKANIDIFVNFSFVRVRFLNRQGYLRYRMKIFYLLNGKEGECHPYNIVKGPVATNTYLDEAEYKADSEIHSASESYYSKLIQVRFRPDDYHEN